VPIRRRRIPPLAGPALLAVGGVDAVVERQRQADAPDVLVGAGVRQVVAVPQYRFYLGLRAVAVGGYARIEKKGV
jgi:hypothetical protein